VSVKGGKKDIGEVKNKMSYSITKIFTERVELVKLSNRSLAARLTILANHFGNGDVVYCGTKGKTVRWRFMEGDSGGWYNQIDLDNYQVTKDFVLTTIAPPNVASEVSRAVSPHYNAAAKAEKAVYLKHMPDVCKKIGIRPYKKRETK
jgi:hypothetical protein